MLYLFYLEAEISRRLSKFLQKNYVTSTLTKTQLTKTMKKVLTAILFLGLMFGTTMIQDKAHAQTQEGDFKLGVGLAFGTGVGFGFGNLDNDLGIRVDGYYAFTPEIRAGGDFTFYFPKEESESFMGATITEKATVWELNLNGHYLFVDDGELIVYALGGINITGISISSEETGSGFNFGGEFSDTEFGLNLGGGLEYDLDFADLFAEAKLGNLGGNANQFVLGAGLRFSF